ncbi:MAG: hypothetical protein IT447_08870, partial [Phycisphaerales bacterium]|nr:hypothetical protein [Phycisphaerales bacterium]
MSRTMPPQPTPSSPHPDKRPAGSTAPPNPSASKPPTHGLRNPPPSTAHPTTKPAAATPKPAGNGDGASRQGATPAPAAPSSTPGMPPIEQLKDRPIGRVLTKMGKVTREQVVQALDFQKSKGGALGRILIDLGYVNQTDLNAALAAQRGYEMINLEGRQISPATIAAVPPQIATTNKVLPLEFNPATKSLLVAMANHENFRALDDLRSLMGYNVKALIGDPEQIDKLIAKYYQAGTESLG